MANRSQSRKGKQGNQADGSTVPDIGHCPLLPYNYVFTMDRKRNRKGDTFRNRFFFKKGEQQVIPLRPYEIREYLENLAKTAFYTGPAFILSVFLFLLVTLIPLYRRNTTILLETFVERQDTG
jgi:hypothetical protein